MKKQHLTPVPEATRRNMDCRERLDKEIQLTATRLVDIKILQEKLKRAIQIIMIEGRQKELYHNEHLWTERMLKFVEEG